MLCVLCVLPSPVRTVSNHILSTQTVSSCPFQTHITPGNVGGYRKQTPSLDIWGLQNGMIQTPRSALKPLSSGGAILSRISSLPTKSKSKVRPVKCKCSCWWCFINAYKLLLVLLLVLIVTVVPSYTCGLDVKTQKQVLDNWGILCGVCEEFLLVACSPL